MQELHDMQQRDPAAKAIVFSQFVNMLDLLEYRIKRGGIDCVKLSGHMNITARDKVLEVCVHACVQCLHWRLCIRVCVS
jgi:DNA repair protein RAD16